ncbi:MAG: molybdopterin-binding protein [Polyangiaceae bacterium]|jgi:molybdopterin-biosynthesis enzyme MoeA-like protein|nr:molybdopterin-binding protein [Polyangiaceae bacterium]
MPRTAAALLIGNELLGGKIQETNLLPLAQLLRSLGVQLRRVVMVLDDRPAIAAEIRSLRLSHDFLFTSGGVGPTHDDVTLAAVADAFDVPLTTSPELEQIIREHFGPRTSEGHLAMARVPPLARLLQGPAPGWPTTVVENVWVLPGLPEAFLEKLSTIRHHLASDSPFLSRAAFTFLDEGTLKPLLDAVVARFPDVEIGSYPTWNDPSYHVKLTFDGTDPARLDLALQAFCDLLPEGGLVGVK